MTLLYDNTNGMAMPEFREDSGFPFDDTEDRGFRARQRLDELAQRHPEFAEHLNPDTWGRSRAASGGAAGDPFARFRNRARFQDFDFPFDFARFDQPQEAPPHHPSEEQQPPQAASKAPPQRQPAPSQSSTSAPLADKPPAGPDGGKKIQQSNTVDLGQPQAPLADATRTHRSMSAPPEHPNRASGGKQQRYVNRVIIPNVNADMGGSASQPQHPQASTLAHQNPEVPPSNPKERIIPIHVEGRDEVVTPAGHSQPPQHSPQPERIFGQRPGIFSKFVNQQDHPQDDLRQQEELRRQQQRQKHQEYMRQQQQPHADAPSQQPSQSPPPPAKPKPSSLELIQDIQKDVSELMTQVENFNGRPKDKTYIYLDEMLTRKMIMLDDIETGGQDAIRKARKEAIKCIQDTIKVLETKAQANDEAEKTPAPTLAEPMDSEQTQPEPDFAPPASAASSASTISTLQPSTTEEITPPTTSASTDAVSAATSNTSAEQDALTASAQLVGGGVERSVDDPQGGAMEVVEGAVGGERTLEPSDSKEGVSEKKRVKKKAVAIK